jgi:hypothetical protein
MATTELLRSKEFLTAEVLASQVREQLDSAFSEIIAAQQLIKRLNEILMAPPGIGGETEDEIIRALARMDRVEDLDVWEIENAGSGAATIADLLSLARHSREGGEVPCSRN